MTTEKRFGLTMTADEKDFGLTMIAEKKVRAYDDGRENYWAYGDCGRKVSGLRRLPKKGIGLTMTAEDILGTKVHEFAGDRFWMTKGKNYRGKKVNCLGLQCGPCCCTTNLQCSPHRS